MNALRAAPATLRAVSLPSAEPESPWEARGFADLVPPATLAEARAHRNDLARLLGREREAAADFLLALADFDRRRGWERLGHASLFAFLTRELALSNAAAWYRLTAARLLPRFPAVEAALRDGRLCLTVVGELSKVLTAGNEAEVLPRFFGRSTREAKELVAAISPCPAPPRRDVVRVVASQAQAQVEATPALLLQAGPPPATPASTSALTLAGEIPRPNPPPAGADAPSLRAREVASTHPARDDSGVRPLTADLRRLHVTVSARFLEKVAAARDGLSHALPGATTEQVLEAALDLLLEKQARSKSLVKRPRAAVASAATLTPPLTPSPSTSLGTGCVPPARRRGVPTGNARLNVPAPVEREVRLRDGDRCQYPLDSGGVCGSTWQVELDHVIPRALGGPTTVPNLRCACRPHNQRAAELELGEAVVAAGRRGRRRGRAAP